MFIRCDIKNSTLITIHFISNLVSYTFTLWALYRCPFLNFKISPLVTLRRYLRRIQGHTAVPTFRAYIASKYVQMSQW